MRTASPVAGYVFEGGFPTPATIERAYDDADLMRAVQAYRFFYPAVSIAGTWRGNLAAGAIPNEVFALLAGSPNQLAFTPSCDTPYAGILLDLRAGPFVIELPPGPLMSVVNDMNQRFVMDLGVSGPDRGRGGKHLILPPGFEEDLPGEYFVGRSSTYRVLLLLRAMPPSGAVSDGFDLIRSIKIRPLNGPAKQPRWIDLSSTDADLTALAFETGLGYWQALHELVDTEPPYEEYRDYYGELAALGIAKGKRFAPDARMKWILERASQLGNAQLRVQSFADRRPERVVWKDRQWEWATLRHENGDFNAPSYKDLDAREKWFFQAQIESPAMFRRSAGAGSLYWLGTRDETGAYLDGGKAYKLTVPLPVPAKMFWSVTVYDPSTRSEIQTSRGTAALRSKFELASATGNTVDLHFGPEAPAGHESRWVQTMRDQGWFAYFRIYGPEAAAFDNTWRPGDFEIH